MTFADWITVACIVLYAFAALLYGLENRPAHVIYFAGATILTVGVLLMRS